MEWKYEIIIANTMADDSAHDEMVKRIVLEEFYDFSKTIVFLIFFDRSPFPQQVYYFLALCESLKVRIILVNSVEGHWNNSIVSNILCWYLRSFF